MIRKIDTSDLSILFFFRSCGVLCAVGMARPLHRFELFVLATLFVFLSLFQRPHGSVWGVTGSAFFGWAFGAAGLMEGEQKKTQAIASATGRNANDQHGNYIVSLFGTGLTLLILLLPVLRFGFNGYR